MAEVKKESEVVYAYKVLHNADGSTDVEPVEVEGKEPIPQAAIYEDVESLAKLIGDNKTTQLVEAAASRAAYYACRKALEDFFKERDVANSEPSVTVEK